MAKMTEEELAKESLILVALGKAFTEQATYLTGRLRHKPKQVFNQAVTAVDLFVKTIDEKLPPAEVEYLASVTDIYHNINIEIKKTK